MFGEQHIRRPIGHDNQHAQRIELPGEKTQQINRRDIGPMQIVKEHHERLRLSNGGQKARQFALHSFLRSGFDFGKQPRGFVALAGKRRDLRIPRRRKLLHFLDVGQVTNLPHISSQQTFQRFEQRQVGFSSGEPFRTTSARNRALVLCREFGEEVFDQCGLADARFARDADERAASVFRCVECCKQFVTFLFTPDCVALCRRSD
ncbi:MAG: hypothetical protein JMDDDDMK_00446 [Acidobacteria bacterium]|nr:hypothetical protein [Acidobacteriota bacterium]